MIDLLGRPLIHWQLDLLVDVPDVRVVVGFNAQSVIDAVLARRRDAVFVFNHDFATTATGDSLLLAARHVVGDVVSLDGDLLVRPADLAALLKVDAAVLGVTPALSDQAVFVEVGGEADAGFATGFSQERRSVWEWTGLIRCPAAALVRAGVARGAGPHHVFQLAAPLLPMRAMTIDTREIDTPADYERAVAWLGDHTAGGHWA